MQGKGAAPFLSSASRIVGQGRISIHSKTKMVYPFVSCELTKGWH